MAKKAKKDIQKSKCKTNHCSKHPFMMMRRQAVLLLSLLANWSWSDCIVNAFPRYYQDLDEPYAHDDRSAFSSRQEELSNQRVNKVPLPIETEQKTIRVAFLGNSLQYYNDLPRLVGEMFENSGYVFKQQNVLRDSGNFRLLWEESFGCKAFWARFCPWFRAMGASSFTDMIDHQADHEPWDYIVMNDHSQHAARKDSRAESMSVLTDEYAPLLAEQGIQPILYQTYAYREPNISGSEDLGNFTEFTEKVVEGYQLYQQAINQGFREWFGTDRESTPPIQAKIAPVGEAFAVIQRTNSDLFFKLYSPDGKHPNALGSLLVAYLIFWTITGEAPPIPYKHRWLWSWKRIRQFYDLLNHDFEYPSDEDALEVWLVAQKVYLEHNGMDPAPRPLPGM